MFLLIYSLQCYFGFTSYQFQKSNLLHVSIPNTLLGGSDAPQELPSTFLFISLDQHWYQSQLITTGEVPQRK